MVPAERVIVCEAGLAHEPAEGLSAVVEVGAMDAAVGDWVEAVGDDGVGACV